jgi:hypothetical protein
MAKMIATSPTGMMVPVVVDSGGALKSNTAPLLDLGTDNVTAFTGADQSIALPSVDAYYIISVVGASCVIRTGGAATWVGRGMYIPEGAVIGPVRIADAGPTLRVIGSAAAGYIRLTRCTF